MDNTIVTQLLIGPLFLLLAALYQAFPPKSINGFYGYRTATSMKSQALWDEANRYSSGLMVKAGIIVTLIQIILNFFLNGYLLMLIPTILLVVLLIAIIPVTETHLSKNFDKRGKKID